MLRRIAKALTSTVLVGAFGLAGCTGTPPPTAPTPTGQRLVFIWEESGTVPPAARPAVDAARDWERAYFQTVTEPSTLDPYLLSRTAPGLLDEIQRAMRNAPRAGGTVRITVIRTTVDSSGVTLGLCEDARAFGVVGAPANPGEPVSPRRLRLSRSDSGEWTAQALVFENPDLDCSSVAGPLPTTPVG